MEKNIPRIFDRLGRPLIIKPAVSGGSMGLGIKNVVDNEDDCREQLLRIQMDIEAGNSIVEECLQKNL